jgi:probable addiction module antidote protein
MALETRPYDAARYLDDDATIAAYLQESLKVAMEDSDPGFLAQALGTVARARGMTEIAQAAGLSRESLYKALDEDGNPEFGTILRVLQALGLKLSITAADSSVSSKGAAA